jgi:hypothetical protein
MIGAPQNVLQRRFPGIYGRPHAYLALSGGGENGAYGAGLLNGWTASETRPEFTMVTGISTGSLIAPFAFLGPEYDDELTEVYTQYSTKDLLRKRPLLSIVSAASAAGDPQTRAPSPPDVYVIRNASLNPVYDPVKPRLVPIAGRSISALIRTQGIGDMYRIYLGAKRDGLDYHLALIPDEFDVKSDEPFDLDYMRQLYQVGYTHGKSGKHWHSAPPGFE